jgi:hypothetical protein
MRSGLPLCIVLALVGRVGGRACEEQCGAGKRNELGGSQIILLVSNLCAIGTWAREPLVPANPKTSRAFIDDRAPIPN